MYTVVTYKNMHVSAENKSGIFQGGNAEEMHYGVITIVSARKSGQVDFLSGQIIFNSHNVQGIRQLNLQKSKTGLAQGKNYFRDTCLKGKLEFKFLFGPCLVLFFI